MSLPNIFQKEVTENVIQRINQLTPTTQAQWGKMNVAQMLAHCSVSYEMIYEDKHKKPNALMRFFLKTFVKKPLVDATTPYKRDSRTAPAFVITGERDFEKEKERLIAYLRKTQELGEDYFDGKESLSFGKLTKEEWSNLKYKHLNHHLSQFGV